MEQNEVIGAVMRRAKEVAKARELVLDIEVYMMPAHVRRELGGEYTQIELVVEDNHGEYTVAGHRLGLPRTQMVKETLENMIFRFFDVERNASLPHLLYLYGAGKTA